MSNADSWFKLPHCLLESCTHTLYVGCLDQQVSCAKIMNIETGIWLELLEIHNMNLFTSFCQFLADTAVRYNRCRQICSDKWWLETVNNIAILNLSSKTVAWNKRTKPIYNNTFNIVVRIASNTMMNSKELNSDSSLNSLSNFHSHHFHPDCCYHTIIQAHNNN